MSKRSYAIDFGSSTHGKHDGENCSSVPGFVGKVTTVFVGACNLFSLYVVAVQINFSVVATL